MQRSEKLYSQYIALTNAAFDTYIEFIRVKELEEQEAQLKRQLYRFRLYDKITEIFGSEFAMKMLAAGYI